MDACTDRRMDGHTPCYGDEGTHLKIVKNRKEVASGQMKCELVKHPSKVAYVTALTDATVLEPTQRLKL